MAPPMTTEGPKTPPDPPEPMEKEVVKIFPGPVLKALGWSTG